MSVYLKSAISVRRFSDSDIVWPPLARLTPVYHRMEAQMMLNSVGDEALGAVT